MTPTKETIVVETSGINHVMVWTLTDFVAISFWILFLLFLFVIWVSVKLEGMTNRFKKWDE